MNHAQPKEDGDVRRPTYTRYDYFSQHLRPSSLVDLATDDVTDGATHPSTAIEYSSSTRVSSLCLSANELFIGRNMTFDENDENSDDLCIELGKLTHEQTDLSPVLDQPTDTSSETIDRQSSISPRSQRLQRLSYFFAPISPQADPTDSSVALSRKRKSDHLFRSDEDETRHINKHVAISEI